MQDEALLGQFLQFTLGTLLKSFQNMYGVFVDTGMVLLGLSFTISAMSGIYQWWTSGSLQDLVSNAVRTIILVAPLLVLFKGWDNYMNTFTNFFHTDLPAAIAQKMGSSSGSGAVAAGSPEAVVGNMIKKLQKSVNFDDKEEPKGPLERLASFFSLKKIYSLIIWIVVLVLNIFLAFAMIFAVFMPIAALQLGIIFGPLILAWLPWRPLADMSSRWLGYMIANGLTFVVAIVMLNALGLTIDEMTNRLIDMSQKSSGFVGIASYLLTLLALFAVYIFSTNLLLQANNIAQGLTGGATVGEGLFGKITASAAAAGMMRAGGATANLNKMAGNQPKKLPGKIGGLLNKAGDKLSTKGYIKSGGALHSLAKPFNAVQKGVNAVGKAGGNVLNRVKNTAVYKELDKPI